MNTLFIIFSLLSFSSLRAAEFEPERLYFGTHSEVNTSLAEMVHDTPKGSVVIIGEYHDNLAHHAHQVALIKELIAQGHKVALGMEFFQTPYQSQVNDYLKGTLSEEEFLQQIKWGKNDFGLYREQIKLAAESSGDVLAINAPSSLTSRIAKVGLGNLSDVEFALIPPGFNIGNDNYYERFFATMQGHVMVDQIYRYFQAQSVWDDTMAFMSTEYKKTHPDQTLVIIVGDFHVRYFGGLPHRLKLRKGDYSATVISQMNLEGLTPAEIDAEMNVDPKYGARADYIWTAKE